MMYRLQFRLRINDWIMALAWPCDKKNIPLRLVANPFDTILYGSEELAIQDMDRWYKEFPQILDAEVVSIPMQGE